MMRILVLLTTLLALAGCATAPTTPSSAQLLGQTCVAYAGALKAVTTLRVDGKLTSSQITTINTVNTTVTPICEGPYPANPTVALSSVNKALATLATIQGTKP